MSKPTEVADVEVTITKVWEVINNEHHLVTRPVSAYIRELEEDLKNTRQMLAEELKKKKNV